MVRIVIAAHKTARLPEGACYLPVFVGAALHQGEDNLPPYCRDDQGENISEKNPLYCELTGLYYAWKNRGCDALGLVHYRRYFAGKDKASAKGAEKDFQRILRSEELEKILEEKDLILPKKQNYYIETLYSHYAHTHDGAQLQLTRQIIQEECPEYLRSFDRIMRERSAHMFNMMVMKEPFLSEYCSWLFAILGKLEQRFSLEEQSAYQRRYIGRIAEILLNVWLDREVELGRINQDRIEVLPLVYLGKVNWFKKGSAFLRAKFLHKRYKESF